MNIPKKKDKFDEKNKNLELHYLFFLDGRVILCKFGDKKKGREKAEKEEPEHTTLKGRKYSFLTVIKKTANMGIVSALDSCDEQDIIYALSDGFSETIQ